MASASDSDVNSKLFGANNGCLDMGFLQRREDELRLGTEGPVNLRF